MVIPGLAMVAGFITTKNTVSAAATAIHAIVQSTIAFLLPFLPVYFAPKTAKTIAGSMEIIPKMVLIPILPIIIP